MWWKHFAGYVSERQKAHVAGSRKQPKLAPFPVCLGMMKNWLQERSVSVYVCVSLCICVHSLSASFLYNGKSS